MTERLEIAGDGLCQCGKTAEIAIASEEGSAFVVVLCRACAKELAERLRLPNLAALLARDERENKEGSDAQR